MWYMYPAVILIDPNQCTIFEVQSKVMVCMGFLFYCFVLFCFVLFAKLYSTLGLVPKIDESLECQFETNFYEYKM